MKRKLFLLLPLTVLLFAGSCREKFNEEDAFNILSKIDLNFFIYDRSSDDYKPISNAEVTVIQGTEELKQISNESGVASFKELQLGTIFYRVKTEGYLNYSNSQNLYNDGGLISQQTLTVGLFNMNDESLATVKGRVLIETDLTNDETEFATGVNLNLRVQVENQYLDFNELTDSEGRYEFRVPAESFGSYSILRIPDLEIPQRIAYNTIIQGDGEQRIPDTIRNVEEVMTIFSTNTSANRNHNNYPVRTIPPLYGIAEPAPNPVNTAMISAVYTDGQGKITGLNFSYGGYYADDPDGKVRVNIYSLAGGSGAYFDFNVDKEVSSLYDVYFFTGNYTMNGGSGYPDPDFLLNRMPYRDPTPYTSDSREKYLGNITPGSTTIINIDFGTGTYRLLDYD